MTKETTLERIKKRFRERASPEEVEAFSFMTEIVEKLKRNEPFTDREKERYSERYKAISNDVAQRMFYTWNGIAISTLAETLDNIENRLNHIEKQLAKRK